jgi:hypothetical protein
MAEHPEVVVARVVDNRGRADLVGVLAATYQQEKHWASDPGRQFTHTDLDRDDVSWFVAHARSAPVGVVRILRDPPVAAYARYGLKALDPAIRVEDFIGKPGIAEVGRFAVLPDSRGQFMVAAALMRAVTVECIERGVTHLITDVFEDDPHSPLGFHTRVLGFHPVATHAIGELNRASRRITLLLDIPNAYKRLRHRNHWFYRYVTSALPEALHERLAA